VDSLRDVPPPSSLSVLSRAELEALLIELFGEIAALRQTNGELREEIARLKSLKGRPDIKPGGMEKGAGSSKAIWRGVGALTPGEGRMPLTFPVLTSRCRTSTTPIAATTSPKWRSRCGTGRNTRRGCVGAAA
jgi:hypothetical protein